MVNVAAREPLERFAALQAAGREREARDVLAALAETAPDDPLVRSLLAA